MVWDEDQPKKRPAYEIGADLGKYSVEELREYLALLDAEKARTENMLISKTSSMQAAHSVFKS